VARTTDFVYDHAIEMRLYAEDPVRFFPSPGPLDVFTLPDGEGIRVETGYRQGNTVSRHYDPLLAKICVGASSRPESIQLAMKALSDVNVQGVKTNKEFLLEVLKDTDFISGKYDVRIAARLRSSGTQVESPVVSSVVGGEGKCVITS
jgi:acetyl-CoA carboxylase biotin carboxylase subunit